MTWIYTDGNGNVLGTNPNNMSGNTGWVQTDVMIQEPLMDGYGIPLYKLDGANIVPRTQEDIDADSARIVNPPTQGQRIAALEDDNHLLLESAGDQEYRICLMELGVSDSDL